VSGVIWSSVHSIRKVLTLPDLTQCLLLQAGLRDLVLRLSLVPLVRRWTSDVMVWLLSQITHIIHL